MSEQALDGLGGKRTLDQEGNVGPVLPPDISGWRDRGLFDDLSEGSGNLEFLDRNKGIELLGRLAGYMLEEGKDTESFAAYKESIEVETEEPEEGKRKVEIALHNLQKDLYDAIIKAFSQDRKGLDPTLELRARNKAMYALSKGVDIKMNWSYSLIQGGNLEEVLGRANNKQSFPLSESVPAVRQVAYEEGIYFDPLKEQMEDRVASNDEDLNHLAELLLEDYSTLQEIGFEKTGKWLFPGKVEVKTRLSKAEGPLHNWLRTEVLYANSHLDENGKYVEGSDNLKKLGKGRRRDFGAVNELLEHLRGLGNSRE